ncbi:hypothetical protein H4R18_003537 [Coemansia javaensis]|uniref:RRM domain-containing protein n=1 Tax=Coemansia javaensis TaxID=2761396 RepID=A0A9W8LH55_9FUNG|nr:hypothetical protein H4R18_003537 [Coemansia javaensis]
MAYQRPDRHDADDDRAPRHGSYSQSRGAYGGRGHGDYSRHENGHSGHSGKRYHDRDAAEGGRSSSLGYGGGPIRHSYGARHGGQSRESSMGDRRSPDRDQFHARSHPAYAHSRRPYHADSGGHGRGHDGPGRSWSGGMTSRSTSASPYDRVRTEYRSSAGYRSAQWDNSDIGKRGDAQRYGSGHHHHQRRRPLDSPGGGSGDAEHGATAVRGPGKYRADIPLMSEDRVRRTLFIRTQHGVSADGREIGDWLSRYGEVADVCDLIERSRVCYVMYFDSRCADTALDHAYEFSEVHSGALRLERSRRRPDAVGRLPHYNDYQATVLVTLEGAAQGFRPSDRAEFEQFGDVRGFFPFQESPVEWVVDYYDCRAAKDAAMAFHNAPFNGGTAHTTFLWDGSAGSSGSTTRSGTYAPCGDKGPARRDSAPSDITAGAAEPPYDARKAAAGLGPAPAKPDMISRLALDPEFMQKAHAAKEMLLQHRDLLGLDTARSSASAPAPVPAAPFSAASKLPASPSDIAPLPDAAPLLPDTTTTTTPLSAPSTGASGVRITEEPAPAEAPLHEPVTASAPSTDWPQSPPAAATTAPPTASGAGKDAQEPDHSDGISRLLGILAQVQKSAQAEKSRK